MKAFHSLTALLLVAALTLPASSMRCLERRIQTYVSCKQDCIFFGDAAMQDLITTCNEKVRFGCALDFVSCPGAIGCVQKPGHPFPVCGNSITIFDEFVADNVQAANFLVDVNALPLKVQYYFLVDTSVSMDPHLNMVKWKIKELISMYKTMPEIDAKFAIEEYRDARFLGANRAIGRCRLRRIARFTDDIPSIESIVDGLSASGGSHDPRGLFPSIAHVAHSLSPYGSHAWDAGARKILVVFGNAPSYEPNKHDLVFLPLPNPLLRGHIVDILNSKDISLIGVSAADPGLDSATIPWLSSTSSPAGMGQISFIAQNTGGVVVSPDKTLMQAVIDAKERYERVYTDAEDYKSKGIVINENVPFELKAKPCTTSTAPISVVVRQKDGFSLPLECQIKFLEDGIELVPMEMKFLKLKGCV